MIDARDQRRYTALAKAASYGHARACAVLVEAGAEVDIWTDDLQTPLIACARNGDYGDAARVLVKAGASQTVVEPVSKMTPLQVAQELRHDGVIAG